MRGGNISLLLCGCWFSMSRSLLLIFSILGLLPFAGVMLSVLCSVFRSVHCSIVASEIRIAVSFSVCSSVAMCFPHDDMSMSISISVGMNGMRSCVM